MQIKSEKNKITFVFQENKINFDFGMMLLNQLALPSFLFGRKQIKRGKELYEVATKGLTPLIEKLPVNTVLQNTKCIFDIFEAILALEEQDLVSKYGIWCKYEHLYWDEQTNSVKFAVLPLSQEVDYEDGFSFEERLMETVSFIAGYLPFNYQKPCIEVVEKYTNNECNANEVLNEIRSMLNDGEEIVREKITHNTLKTISLVYLIADVIQEYEMKKDEIIIGKNLENVDIDFSHSSAVSRLHCKLLRQNQSFFVQDLDSLNHTLVNGERVPPYELMELCDRDLITLGDVELRVIIS